MSGDNIYIYIYITYFDSTIYDSPTTANIWYIKNEFKPLPRFRAEVQSQDFILLVQDMFEPTTAAAGSLGGVQKNTVQKQGFVVIFGVSKSEMRI